ncbi:MAG: hypothetical protein JJV97_04375 [SAR324 cluster bacterium]|nr:hypothetical protein [SAR324 cluster bacterium]
MTDFFETDDNNNDDADADNQAFAILAEEEKSLSTQDYDIKRIQGTDGVRGKMVFNTKNPLYDLIHKRLISPQFIEFYVYSWGRLLIEESSSNGIKEGEVSPKNEIIIAQDPRDKSDAFLKAAISGINKAGLKVVYIGHLPTPAIPFYLLIANAIGGIMLTASHNSADEHGIKLFDNEGFKYLPEYDYRLTEIVKTLDYQIIANLPGNDASFKDNYRLAKEEFIKFSLKSWHSLTNHKPVLKDYRLVLDLSNGATCSIAKEIFTNLGAKEVFMTNDSFDNEINKNCGVCDFEEKSIITKTNWQEKDSKWRKFATINLLFKLSVPSGDNLVGIIFDGDGDRFVMLEYDKNQDAILIRSGDYLAAKFIDYETNNSANKAIVNTIESDHCIDSYAKSKGWQIHKQSIGDKWLASCVADLANKKLKKDIIFGYESSGHFIFLEEIKKTNPNKDKFIIAGNGVLAALHALAVLDNKQPTSYLPGKRFTMHIYFINKSKLGNLDFKNQLKDMIITKISDYENLGCQAVDFEFEEDLVNFNVFDQHKTIIGRIFIRNSGTENKATISVRCEKSAYTQLSNIATEIYTYLWFKLKDLNLSENNLIIKILTTENEKMLSFHSKYPKIFQKVRSILEDKELLITNQTLTPLGQSVKNLLINKINQP